MEVNFNNIEKEYIVNILKENLYKTSILNDIITINRILRKFDEQTESDFTGDVMNRKGK